jgi:small multidrug resistance pump
VPWILLALAIGTEIAATTALKASDGLTRLVPSIVVAVGYVASFVLLAKALKSLDVGVAYAIWSGVGTAVVAALGVLLFAESMSVAKAFWIAVIVVGVIGLQATSGSAH